MPTPIFTHGLFIFSLLYLASFRRATRLIGNFRSLPEIQRDDR
jgi:hypothetical protein